MLSFKPGVRVRGVAPEALVILLLVEQVFREEGFECIVTSCVDGAHSETSLHYIGHAWDFRSKHLPDDATKRRVASKCREALAPLGDVDFILEGVGTANEHFHGEWQPKRSAGYVR